MGITINTEPIEVVIDGTTILMQGDPTATPAWDQLMDIEVIYSDPKKRDIARAALMEALSALAETPDDAEQLTKLDLGVATLRKFAHAYAQEVTGFPTQPPSTSKKR